MRGGGESKEKNKQKKEISCQLNLREQMTKVLPHDLLSTKTPVKKPPPPPTSAKKSTRSYGCFRTMYFGNGSKEKTFRLRDKPGGIEDGYVYIIVNNEFLQFLKQREICGSGWTILDLTALNENDSKAVGILNKINKCCNEAFNALRVRPDPSHPFYNVAVWVTKPDSPGKGRRVNLNAGRISKTNSFKNKMDYLPEFYGKKLFSDFVAKAVSSFSGKEYEAVVRAIGREYVALKLLEYFGLTVPKVELVLTHFEGGKKKIMLATKWHYVDPDVTLTGSDNNTVFVNCNNSQQELSNTCFAGQLSILWAVLADRDLLGSGASNTEWFRREEILLPITFDAGKSFNEGKYDTKIKSELIENIDEVFSVFDPGVLQKYKNFNALNNLASVHERIMMLLLLYSSLLDKEKQQVFTASTATTRIFSTLNNIIAQYNELFPWFKAHNNKKELVTFFTTLKIFFNAMPTAYAAESKILLQELDKIAKFTRFNIIELSKKYQYKMLLLPAALQLQHNLELMANFKQVSLSSSNKEIILSHFRYTSTPKFKCRIIAGDNNKYGVLQDYIIFDIYLASKQSKLSKEYTEITELLEKVYASEAYFICSESHIKKTKSPQGLLVAFKKSFNLEFQKKVEISLKEIWRERYLQQSNPYKNKVL